MNIRTTAARILVHVLEGQSLTSALDSQIANFENAQEKAFVQALCYGACRYFHRLEFILNQLVSKSIKDNEIKALALLGLYQLEFMRVKTHAAVSETVQAIPKKKSWAKGLLNAVLRNFLREQEKIIALANTNKIAELSHPDWLIKKIEHDWGVEKAREILCANNVQPPMILRVNITEISRANYLNLLHAENIAAENVADCKTAIRLINPVIVENLPHFFEGWVSVQDTAAQFAAEFLDLHVGQRVLDLCAAPGGKMAHCLETISDLEMVAVEIDATRMERVKMTCKRLNLTAQLIVGDATQPETWWDGRYFDRILLDAPCSALGVIRRHPDIKLLRRATDIDALQQLQQQILTAAWQLLKPNGLLLYATCSILKQENEQQIANFLEKQADAQEILFSEGKNGRQILTGDAGMDGFFYARLVKKAL